MTNRIDCEHARSQFPDLIDRIADAAVRKHVDKCAPCREELEAFRAVLEAASSLSRYDVPDPGDRYWGGFLPSVRARIRAGEPGALAGASARFGLVAAAAAVMLAVGVGLAILPARDALRTEPVETVGLRLERLLGDLEELPLEETDLLVSPDCRLFHVNALHASRLEFLDPFSGERLEFEAPIPPDLRNLQERLRDPSRGR